jgi:threonine/homoserine/homoserine lactone efflux protein
MENEGGGLVRRPLMLEYLLLGGGFAFAAVVQPGPLQAFLLARAASEGWRRTLPAAFAPLLSDGPIAVLILTILSRVPPSLVKYLQILGGAFLLYLAHGAWKTWRRVRRTRRADAGDPLTGESGPNRFLKAAMVNWLNPNPYLGWSVFLGPAVIAGWRSSPPNGIALLIGFYATIIATMIAMIVLFAAARTLGPRVRRTLIGLSAIALACLGVYQLWMGGVLLLIK